MLGHLEGHSGYKVISFAKSKLMKLPSELESSKAVTERDRAKLITRGRLNRGLLCDPEKVEFTNNHGSIGELALLDEPYNL